MLARKVGRPNHHRLAYRINGVECKSVNGSVFIPYIIGLLIFLLTLLHLTLGFLGIIFVHDVVAYDRTYTHFSRRFLAALEEPVLVVEGGGARAYHFYARYLCGMIYIFMVDIGFDFPDFIYPVFEHHIFAYSPHKRHAGMGMHIDETGNCHFVCAVHDFTVSGYIPIHTRACRAYSDNPSLVYEHVLALICNGYVL